MQVLVTGGSGFIGSHVCARLAGMGVGYKNYDIKCGDDVFNIDSLSQAINGADVIIHLVAESDTQTCQSNPMRSFNLNLAALQSVLVLCRNFYNKKLVYPSTAAVYGIQDDLPIKESAPLRPNNIYSHHKLLCERMIQVHQEHYGLEYVILRLFNVYGKGVKQVFNRFVAAAGRREVFRAFGVSQYRDFVWTGDVADALCQAALSDKAKNKIVNIGSGRGEQIRSILDMIKEVCPGAEWCEERGNVPLYDSIADITKAGLLLDYKPHSGRDFMMKVIREEICQSPLPNPS